MKNGPRGEEEVEAIINYPAPDLLTSYYIGCSIYTLNLSPCLASSSSLLLHCYYVSYRIMICSHSSGPVSLSPSIVLNTMSMASSVTQFQWLMASCRFIYSFPHTDWLTSACQAKWPLFNIIICKLWNTFITIICNAFVANKLWPLTSSPTSIVFCLAHSSVFVQD